MLRRRYAAGVEALDRCSRESFGAPFAALGSDHQDDVLRAIEANELHGDESVEDELMVGDDALPFFHLLAAHTRQAFYSDPVYGGNRDRVGWSLIGFPGPESLASVIDGSYTA
jgi:gluconate 2-dehydrogenase gamma chain